MVWWGVARKRCLSRLSHLGNVHAAEGVQVAPVGAVVAHRVTWRVVPRWLLMGGDVVFAAH